MQQRQLRLGDILDDYCPRERRVTNHAIVAMVGADVKQTRCTTCDTEHEYKHAKVPRQRRKTETPAGAVFAGAGRRPEAGRARSLAADGPKPATDIAASDRTGRGRRWKRSRNSCPTPRREAAARPPADDHRHRADEADRDGGEEGPVHGRLIRATLPRPEGQPPAHAARVPISRSASRRAAGPIPSAPTARARPAVPGQPIGGQPWAGRRAERRPRQDNGPRRPR